jgi:hypothetical protein
MLQAMGQKIEGMIQAMDQGVMDGCYKGASYGSGSKLRNNVLIIMSENDAILKIIMKIIMMIIHVLHSRKLLKIVEIHLN